MHDSLTSKIGIAGKLLAGLALLAATASGAGFWDKKDFTQWTGKEIAKMMFDSPWCKKVTVTGTASVQMGGGAGGLDQAGGGRAPGGGAGGRGGGGGAGGGRGRGGGGGQGVQMAPSYSLIVRFQTALPVRRAIAKHNMGESTEVPAEIEKFLNNEDGYFVVAVEQLPQMFERLFGDAPEKLVQTAKLRRRKKDDILPVKAEVKTGPNTVSFLYYFSREADIQVSDKQLELVLRYERPAAGQGQPGQRARGQGQAGQRPGGQQQRAGAQGGQGGQQRAGAQGQGGQRPGGGGRGNPAMFLMGKDIKKRFALRDMVTGGNLAL